MSYAVIIVAVIVTLVTIYLVYTAITASPAATGTISIVGPISDGRKQFDSPTQIPTSFNQAQGMTFSYACWVKINDFSYRYGAPKVVFTKGPIDLSVMCPALFLDAIAVSQESVDIYVDGNLYIHHTLTQIPKQNSETVHTTIAGGFDGSIAGLTHYNYLLTPESIAPIMASAPVTAQDTTVVPPYHDQSFWLSHLTDGR